MKLGEIVVHMDNYIFTKFHQNQMKNKKKVLLKSYDLPFAIKMLLGNTYGLLNLLEFKCTCFNSLFKAEYEFQNSNVGGKGY